MTSIETYVNKTENKDLPVRLDMYVPSTDDCYSFSYSRKGALRLAWNIMKVSFRRK